MGVTQINKYVWLINRLSSGNRTLEELTRAWGNRDGQGLSRRTFINWKTEIENRFGIKIQCKKAGKEYLYHIDSRPGDTDINDWLLRTLSIENTIASATDISDRIVLESVPSGEANLQPILEAIRENRCISFTYTDYWEDAIQVVIKPYFVKLVRQRWHVIGPAADTVDYKRNSRHRSTKAERKREYESIRSYALDSDRFSDLKVLDQAFKYPEDFNPKEFFADNYGTLVDDRRKNPVAAVRVLVWEKQNFYFRSVPLHHSQQEIYTSIKDGYSIFEYRLQPTLDFIMDLRSFGNYVEVLEPESLRKAMIRDAKDVLSEYGGVSRESCKEDVPFVNGRVNLQFDGAR